MHNDLPQFSGYPENWHQICLTILKTSGVFTPILRVALKTMKCSNPIFLFSPQPLSFKTMNCFTPIFVASSSKNVRFWTRLFIIPLSLCPRNHKVSPCPKNHELFYPNFQGTLENGEGNGPNYANMGECLPPTLKILKIFIFLGKMNPV